MPPTDFLLKLTEWTLTNNIFIFQDKIFKQTKGCAMWTSYAGLFLGKWEEDFVLNGDINICHKNILWYGHFIADLCLFRSGSENELEKMILEFLNNISSNIELSLEYSKESINFLDLTITKDEEGTLLILVYRKPTDRNTILHGRSFHPKWLKDNVPCGQFQRIRRICDQDQDFENKSQEMRSRFVKQGYNNSTLQNAYSIARQTDRTSLLKRNQRDQRQTCFCHKVQHTAN